MKVKTLSALAGVGTAMILSSASQAAYVNLVVTSANHTVPVGDFGMTPGTNMTTHQVWAVFNNAADTLNAVSGTPLSPLTIQSRNAANNGAGTGFLNNGLGSDEGSVPGIGYTLSPSLVWDTYLSIGYENAIVNLDTTDDTGFSPDFLGPGGFSMSTGGNALINHSWFVSGTTGQNTAGADLRVLLGQFSVAQGENVRGTVQISWNPLGLAGSGIDVLNQTFDSFVIPAPGALALLGLAGLVGARRRRA